MEKKTRLRPPLTYYGGKQTLGPWIISLIPEHILYCEPFFGGGAVYFMKPPSEVEVINDTNKELMNFYRVAVKRFDELAAMIELTLHSRDAHHSATLIYHNPELFDEVKRAWAVWTLSALGFSGKLEGVFGFDKSQNSTSKRIDVKRESFNKHYLERLRKTQIECADALYIIQSRDHKGAFFYCDPPYIGSNMGHYKGYTEHDYEQLLHMLSTIEGKFLLSSYPSEILDHFIRENNWNVLKKEMHVTVNMKAGNPKRKIEMLVANYPIENNDLP